MEEIIRVIIEQGLIFSLLVTAVYFSWRILSFPDLTVEGSFGIGGAIMSQTVFLGMHWVEILVLIVLAGASAGFITGMLHARFGINKLMSGIIVSTALYSINLIIAGAHLPIIFANSHVLLWGHPIIFWVLMLSVILVLGCIKPFLNTEVGFMFRALGTNPQVLTSLGKDHRVFQVAGLMISNVLAALSGALFAQSLGFFSIQTGVGILVIALAGVALTESLTTSMPIWLRLSCGALAYPTIIAFVFELELNPAWNKLVIAIVIVGLLLRKQHEKELMWR